MVPPETVFSRVPRLPALTGTVIDSAPPVMVTVADVSAAQAGPARPSVSMPAPAASSRARVRMLFIAILSPQSSGQGMDQRVELTFLDMHRQAGLATSS